MNQALRYCSRPACGEPIEDPQAQLCPACGLDLGLLGADATEEAPTDPGAYAPPAPGKDIRMQPPVARDVQPGEAVKMVAQQQHHSEALDVSYNVSRLFVEGLEMPFQFRFIPRVDGLSAVCVEIRRKNTPLDEELIARDEPCWFPFPGKEMDNPIGFRPPPGTVGLVTFDIYIGYQIDGVQCWHVARKTHPVFQRKTKIDSAIHQLNVQLNNEVQQGHASDVQVRQTLDGIEKLVHPKSEFIEDFRSLDVPELWVALPLNRCHYRPLAQMGATHRRPPQEALKTRMTLGVRGRRVHVMSNTTIQLGRSRENDLVTRIVRPDGTCPEKPNRLISRYHCRLQVQDNHCVLNDKGWNPGEGMFVASALGTMLNNKPLPQGGSRDIPSNSDFTISLSGQGQNAEDQFVLEGHLWTCGALGEVPASIQGHADSREPAAMLLNRKGDPGECFLVLWKHFPVAILNDEFGGAYLCRRSEAFSLEVAGGCEWLVPEREYHLPAGRLKVEHYRPQGLDKNPR